MSSNDFIYSLSTAMIFSLKMILSDDSISVMKDFEGGKKWMRMVGNISVASSNVARRHFCSK
jgi:hypothetical protein